MLFAALWIGSASIVSAHEEAEGEIVLPSDQKSVQSLTEMSLEDLLSIEITTASKFKEDIFDAPGMVSVITRDELLRFGGTNLKHILERVPGVFGATTYITDRSTIAARGDHIKPNSSHVLFLINGRPTREVLEGGISTDLLESFPVNALERIEVVKGPGSVLYGSDAMSLVVNLVTRTSESEATNEVNLRGMGLLTKGFNTSGEVVLREGDLDLTVAVQALRRERWEVDYEYPNQNGGGYVSSSLSIPNEGFGTFASAKYHDFRLMAATTKWTTGYFALTGSGQNDSGRVFGNLGYDWKLDDSWNMTLDTTYTHAFLETSDEPDISRNSHNFVAEWTNYLTPLENLKLSFGSYYELSRGREETLGVAASGGFSAVSNETRSTLGFYTQADYWLIQNVLKLIGGVQVNKVQDVATKLLPRGGIVWYPIPSINVKVLYSRAFRAPSINEIGLSHPQLSGNPNLRHEILDAIDVGVSYVGRTLQAGVSYFFSKQSDIIFSDFSSGLPGQYINAAELTIHGAEAETKFYLTSELFLTGSFLFQHNEDQTGATEVTPFPSFLAKGGISYACEKHGIVTGLYYQYQSELGERFADSVLEPRPKAFHRMYLHTKADLKKLLGFHWKHDVSLIAQIDNLLNQEMYWPDYGGIGTIPTPYVQGIQAFLGFELGFNL